MILKMAAVVKVQYSIIFCKDIFTALLSLSIFKHMFLTSSYQFSLICVCTLHKKPTTNSCYKRWYMSASLFPSLRHSQIFTYAMICDRGGRKNLPSTLSSNC